MFQSTHTKLLIIAILILGNCYGLAVLKKRAEAVEMVKRSGD